MINNYDEVFGSRAPLAGPPGMLATQKSEQRLSRAISMTNLNALLMNFVDTKEKEDHVRNAKHK
jgi:hypothetical protein